MFRIRSIAMANTVSWIATIVVMSFAFTSFFVHEKWADFERRIEVSKASFLEYKRDVLRGDVDNAIKFIQYQRAALGLDKLAQQGLNAKRAELESQILESLGKIRFGRGAAGNVFVMNHYGAMLWHPGMPLFQGLNPLRWSPSAGGRPFEALLEASRSPDGAFSSFAMPSTDGRHSELVSRLVYAKRVSSPDWVVCSEVSEPELSKEISESRSALRSKLLVDISFIVVAALIVTLGALWFSYSVSVSMKREIDMLVAYCKGSASGAAHIAEEQFFFDEFRFISSSLLSMVRSIRSLVGTVKELALRSELGSQAKSGFISSISREIRTPMNGILGMTGILKESHLDTAQRECVEAIDVSAQSLVRLVNDIRDFSAVESGRLSAIAKPFSLLKVLNEVVEKMSARAMERGDKVELSVDATVKDRVIGDGGKLSQILKTLVANAVKFTSEGSVKVEAFRKGDSADGLGAWYEFKVVDTGLGISEAKLHSIFDFAGEGHSEAGKFGGVSLGLAVARNMVEAMGGVISASSEKGKGSVFSFSIPLREPSPEDDFGEATATISAMAGADEGRPPLAGVNALVAEDDAINRRVAKAFLEKLGCSVELAVDGQEAVAKAAKVSYDIIFMDCEMPVLDGYAAARAIRASEGLEKHTPIVAMTANALHGDMERSLEAGMDGHIPKPITTEVVVQSVIALVQPKPPA